MVGMEHKVSVWTLVLVLIGACSSSCNPVAAQSATPSLVNTLVVDTLVADLQDTVTTEKVRCIALEAYVRTSDESSRQSLASVQAFVAKRRGVRLRIHDLDQDNEAADRLTKITEFYKLENAQLPFVYGLNQAISSVDSEAKWNQVLEELLRVEVYVRTGCSRCVRAKEYLPSFRAKYPGLEVQVLDVTKDANASRQYNEIARNQRIGGISFPGFWICKQLIVGFDSTASGAARLDNVLNRWTFDCELPKFSWLPRSPSRAKSFSPKPTSGEMGHFVALTIRQPTVNSIRMFTMHPRELLYGLSSWVSADQGDDFLLPIDDQPIAPLEIGDQDSLDLPSDELADEPSTTADEEIEVPWLGRLSVKQLGMPAFTFLVGLIDGFNPCAMWVLLFLLSILVNLRDRWKILAVAGTFIFISGLAYFAFIAAWLNVLLLVGYLRWVQIILAVLAIVVGSIHIKDFFAFKRGISLSIPEAAKPGIYARVRKIVMAEHLYGAILGAAILAVLVNFIELLCTAGLPAMYTQVLSLQNFPAWKNYAYLLLYIIAYMLDDSIMVAIVVVTLGKRKLQEKEGRWLKLLSGLVVLALGLVLLLKPEWLE